MPVAVTLQTVHPRKLAAVRREVAPREISSAWGPALDKVWEFVRSQRGLRTDGHNVFVYHEPTHAGAPILCDFGVEVTRTFETAGEVYATETPAGEAAVAVHRGAYNRMNETYNAIKEWMAVNRRTSAGHSWDDRAASQVVVGADASLLLREVVDPELARTPLVPSTTFPLLTAQFDAADLAGNRLR
jgi:effector-binding domain-containing protein